MFGTILGLKPRQFEIMPLGFSVKFEVWTNENNKIIIKKLITALAGPFTNIILIAIFFNFDINIIQTQVAIYSNILICLFNLMPIYPLDGWRIINELLHIKLKKTTADRYAKFASLIAIIGFTVFCSIATYYFKNISFFLIDILLWIKYFKEV